jgi:hypothetical protein
MPRAHIHEMNLSRRADHAALFKGNANESISHRHQAVSRFDESVLCIGCGSPKAPRIDI